VTPAGFADMTPMKKLLALGFTEDAAKKMAEKEHQSWYDYLVENGWRWGPQRSEMDKLNPRLLKWDAPDAESKVLEPTLRSLAGTLLALRQLGYRSRPAWQRFRRTGTVTARQRQEPWTWISHTGDEMRAEAGDWEVSNDGSAPWSVQKDRFVETYEHLEGDRWRRTGTALARRALEGEIIETLEGPEQAKGGDWVVKSDRGEQWPVPAADFPKNYEGPLPGEA
jgi:RyR domain